MVGRVFRKDNKPANRDKPISDIYNWAPSANIYKKKNRNYGKISISDLAVSLMQNISLYEPNSNFQNAYVIETNTAVLKYLEKDFSPEKQATRRYCYLR